MIQDNSPVAVYTADGTQTQWDIPFEFSDASEIHLFVSHEDAISEILATDFYVDVDNLNVTYPVQAEGVEEQVTPLPQGDILIIARGNAITQEEDSSLNAFKSPDVERMADKLTKICQELAYKQNRTVHYNPLVADEDMITDATEFMAASEAYADDAIAAHNTSNTAHTNIRTLISNHISNTSNPHNVTKEQVGLGNVDNTSDANKPVSVAMQAALNLKQDNLTQVQLAAVNSGIDSEQVDQIGINTAAIASEIADRENADTLLQNQITALDNNKQNNLTSPQLAAVNSGIDSTKVAAIATNTSDISAINAKIPSEATTSNQLADKSYVNDAVNSLAAYYVTSTAQGGSFATKAALDAGPWYFDGSLRTPTTNDYAIVANDETHNNRQARYVFTGTLWSYQWTFNDAVFTQAQLNAMDSGITASKVSSYDTHLANTSNPHSVTKSQVGLGNVDNTSDLNKPISTATQNALDALDSAKSSNADGSTIVDNGATISTVAVKEQNANVSVKEWVGTKAQYDAIATKDANTIYTVTDEDDSAYLTVDSTLSSTSTNPVQNNVIKAALDAKQATIADLSTIRSNASSGASAANTIAAYGDIVAHNASEFLTAHQDISGKEDTSNKVTSLSSSSTNTEYPSAKCVYDSIPSTTQLSYYGTCSTAAATQNKVVDCDGFVLNTGVSIRVKFINNQTYNGAPTLNVNSTGAISVKSIGTTNSVRYCWLAGEVVAFTYDGTNWIMEDAGIATTSYYGYTALTTSATNTSAARAATPASINNLVLNMIEPYNVYSTTSTYAVGDRVRYNYQAWECNTAITTAEAWTANHWTALDPIQTQLDDKVAKNAAITGATKTKITYDSKGLVTAGADLSATDIPNLDSAKVNTLSSYAKATAAAAIQTSDNLNTALGKLEYKADLAIKPTDVATSSSVGVVKVDGTSITVAPDGTLSATSSGVPWGSVTGTLSDQTDLQTALNAKQDTISDLSTIRSGASAGATALQNTATGTNALTVAGTVSTTSQAHNVGDSSSAAIYGASYGYSATASTAGTAIGTRASAGDYGVAIGSANGSSSATTASGSSAIAIGYNAKATANTAIQIGTGTNATANTVQINSTQILDANGKIPAASLDTAIPAAQVNSDWNSSSGVSEILNKPTLATVATSGSYNDLSGKPTLATVATSGSYNDLSNKPTISSIPLFYHTFSDHLFNDTSWLRADTYSWQDGTVYTSAYQHLVDDVAAAVAAGTTGNYEVINGIGLWYDLAPDGHKIISLSGWSGGEQALADLYNATGVAWYYILDIANTRFKLPRTKYNVVGLRDSVGSYVAESLPNITGQTSGVGNWSLNSSPSGAFTAVLTGSLAGPEGSQSYNHTAFNFNASRSSSAYQDNAPVQQRATQMYLYFYCGNTVQNQTTIDIGQITETLNDKADTDLSNVAATSGFRRLVEIYNNGTSWYKVFDEYDPSTGNFVGKWCEQGGYVNSLVGSVASGWQVTFLKAFADTNYTITFLSSHGDTSTNGVAVQYGNYYYGCYYPSSKSTTGIMIRGQGTWQAEGYIS